MKVQIKIKKMVEETSTVDVEMPAVFQAPNRSGCYYIFLEDDALLYCIYAFSPIDIISDALCFLPQGDSLNLLSEFLSPKTREDFLDSPIYCVEGDESRIRVLDELESYLNSMPRGRKWNG